MYQTFFGLRQAPFELAADSSSLVELADQRSALDAIAELVRNRVGMIWLEGWPGTGKTELLHAYARSIDPDLVSVVAVATPDLDRIGLLAAFGEALIGPFALQPSFEDVQKTLARRTKAGQATVLLIDDAQDLTDDELKELGAFTAIDGSGGELLSVVLAGRPPLIELLNRPAAAALKIRTSGRVRLPPLTPAAARTLIEERLRRAGAANPEALLSSEAIEAIVIGSSGLPRRLLELGDRVLRAGFAQGRLPIDYATAEAAIEGDGRSKRLPAKPKQALSTEPGRFASAGRAFVRLAAKIGVLEVALLLALGIGLWLWQYPDQTLPTPMGDASENTDLPQVAALMPPTPSPPSPPQPAPSSPSPPAEASRNADRSDAKLQLPPILSPSSPPQPAPSPPSPPAEASRSADKSDAKLQLPPPPAAAAPAARPSSVAPAAAPLPTPEPMDVLFIFARHGDSLRSLYRTAYRSPGRRPSYDELLAVNPGLEPNSPLEAGQLVALPAPLPGR
ncbi:MAG TPA: AAA family ATPase [Aliidongia sp.]|nr:AAA family ATPase [Aliidongia sp.]